MKRRRGTTTTTRGRKGEDVPPSLRGCVLDFVPLPRPTSGYSTEGRPPSTHRELEGDEDEDEVASADAMEVMMTQSPPRAPYSTATFTSSSSPSVRGLTNIPGRGSSSATWEKGRDDVATAAANPASSEEEEENVALSSRLKRVKISKQTPGQLRLAKDVLQCRRDAKLNGLLALTLDKGEGQSVLVNDCYVVSVGKYYPHAPPAVHTSPAGLPVALPILSAWNPTFSLRDVLLELIASPPVQPVYNNNTVEMMM